eukprot:6212507-Pleurochrysis_carterae.AAC.4
MSWAATTAAEHDVGKGKMATNDPAESAFGAITHQELNRFGRIAFGSASGVTTARENMDFPWGPVAMETPKRRPQGASERASGWSDLTIAWSKRGVELTVAELLAHVKKIIQEQRERAVPKAPPMPGIQRKRLLQLGKRTAEVAALECKQLASSEALVTEG